MAGEREFRSCNGVDFFEDGDERWFLFREVRKILGIGAGTFAIPDGEKMDVPYYGVTEEFVSSGGLATLVDRFVDDDLGSINDLWRQAWYEDLMYQAEGAKWALDSGSPLRDHFADVVNRAGHAERVRIRERAEDAIAELSDAAERIEKALTYLDGFGRALSITGHCDACGSPMYTPIDAVTLAIAKVNEAMEAIESIAEGDDR